MPKTDPPDERASERARERVPRTVAQLLVLLGLTGFAISQPLLSVLGNSPTLFTFYKVTGWTILWLALGIAFVPPLVLWLLGLGATAIDERLGTVVHLTTVAALVGLVAIQALKEVGATQTVLLAVGALVAAVGAALLYRRYHTVGVWLMFTAPLPVLALLLFVLASPTSDLFRTSGSTAAAATQNPEELPSVVFVMLDEMPTLSLLDAQGGIDATRFPNLAEFADDATWYRHFTASAPFTSAAVPSMLSGTEPVHTEPLWTNHPDNLFTLLEPTHDFSVFESLTYLCATATCLDDEGGANRPRLGELLGEAAGLFRDRIAITSSEKLLDDFEEDLRDNPNEFDPDADPRALSTIQARPERLDQFLDSIGPRTAPELYYLHLMFPHHPWRFYPDGQLYDPPPVPNVPQFYPFSYDNDHGPWVSALTEQRHLLQAQYTDALLGSILDELKAEGVYDDSLVIITADHGASFRDDEPMREISERGETNLADIVYVPLFIKAPGQTAGVVDDSNLMATDLLPTIADLVGVEVTWPVVGAPAGSAEVLGRGDEKQFHDYAGGLGERELRDVITFDDREAFPDLSERFITTPGNPFDPLYGLYELIDANRFRGQPLPEPTVEAGDRAEVVALDRLRHPADGEAPPGLVTGRLIEGEPEGLLLIGVNGVIMAGSPFYELDDRDGYYSAILPAGALQRDNEIELVVVDRGQVREVDEIHW